MYAAAGDKGGGRVRGPGARLVWGCVAYVQGPGRLSRACVLVCGVGRRCESAMKVPEVGR